MNEIVKAIISYFSKALDGLKIKKNIKNFLILFFCIIILIIFGVIYLNNVFDKNGSVQNREQEIQNSGLLQNNEYGDNNINVLEPEPKFDIEFIEDNHKEKLDEGGVAIFYNIENDNFAYGMTDSWSIKILNNGDGTADNIHIKLEIEDMLFEGETSEYMVTSHVHGIGGYAALEYFCSESLNPDENFILPKIPLEIMHSYGQDSPFTDSSYNQLPKFFETNIIITIYADNMKSIQIKHPLTVSTDEDLMFLDDMPQEQQYVEQLLLDFAMKNTENMVEGIGIYSFYMLNSDNMNLDVTDIENYHYIYNYMLNNIYADNRDLGFEFKKNAIFWGRIYYKCMYGDGDKNYIEMMINNDLEAHLK